MRIRVLAAALTCAAAFCATTTTPPSKAAPKKTAHAKTAHAKTAHVTRKRATKKTKARTAWHPAQAAPTPERYKEIQEALAKKGYLHGEATGVWNADSVDALRHFQKDQNLQASGKLDSLSLIALGLGPKSNVPPPENARPPDAQK